MEEHTGWISTWNDRVGDNRTEKQKEMASRHNAKTKAKARENRKKGAQGDKIEKKSPIGLSEGQIHNILSRRAHHTREMLRRQGVSKAERRAAVRAIMTETSAEVIEAIREEQQETRSRRSGRDRITKEDAKKPREALPPFWDYDSDGESMDEPQEGPSHPSEADDMAIVVRSPEREQVEEPNWGGDDANEPNWGGMSQ